MGVIYKITNQKEDIYVGQTIDFNKRLERYRCMSAISKQRKLAASIKKYGFDFHTFEILEKEIPIEKLNEREIYWIKECNSYYKYNREHGMNLNSGGNTPIWDSIRIKEFSEKFKGERNPFYGKTHSEETRKFYSEKAKIQFKGHTPTRKAIELGAIAKRRGVIVFNIDGSVYEEFISLTSTALHFKLDITTIRDVLNGKSKTIKGKYTCIYKTALHEVGEQSS